MKDIKIRFTLHGFFLFFAKLLCCNYLINNGSIPHGLFFNKFCMAITNLENCGHFDFIIDVIRFKNEMRVILLIVILSISIYDVVIENC